MGKNKLTLMSVNDKINRLQKQVIELKEAIMIENECPYCKSKLFYECQMKSGVYYRCNKCGKYFNKNRI